MKDNPNLAWKAAKKGAKKSAKALIKQWQKSDPAGRAQRVYTKATEIQDEYGEIWSKGGDIVNVAMLLLGAKLEVNGDPEFLHVMPEGGKPIVTVTATATFESDLAQERLPCYAMAGISVPPNGPMSGFRIRWSITQPVGGVGLGQGKFLKIPTGQAQAFQTTGGGGQITGSDGKAKVTLDVAHERDPGVGKKQKGKVWVRATLDKDDFPFKMSDAWSFWNPGWAGEKIWELILSAASRLGLPSQPVLITVEYHDNEPYSIKGTRRIFGFYYIIPIELDLYTCEGLDGPWHGTVKFHGDRDFLGDAANKVFGRHFPMTVDQSWSTNFTPRFGQNALGQANPSTMVTLVGPLNGLIDIDTGWRALQRTQGAVIGTMTLMGEAGGELEALAFFDGFDLSYPIKVGAPAHCPPGGLYFP